MASARKSSTPASDAIAAAVPGAEARTLLQTAGAEAALLSRVRRLLAAVPVPDPVVQRQRRALRHAVASGQAGEVDA